MVTAIPKELSSLLDALHDGVTDLAKGTALKSLDHWHDLLTEAAKPELKAISKDIDSLRKLLSGDDLDGGKIGKAMIKLADHIENLTDTDASKGIKTRLTSLGRLLRNEGEELTGENSDRRNNPRDSNTSEDDGRDNKGGHSTRENNDGGKKKK